MYPHERSLVKHLNGKPFALVGINSDPDTSIPQELAKSGKVTWRSFWSGPEGTGGPIPTEWGVSGWPTIYLIDGEGKLRYQWDYKDPADIDKQLAMLFSELGEEFPTEEIHATTEEETKRTFD